MRLNSLILLLLSNAITSRRDKSILYSRATITILLFSAYKRHSKHLELSVVIIGIATITKLLGLNFFACILLLIIIILSIFLITKGNYNHFLYTLELLWLITVIVVTTLTDLAITP